MYAKFFVIAPAGQGCFSSTTLLLFIADMLVQMTMGMYTEPQGMVEEDAALGLRHVGFGIPTVLLPTWMMLRLRVVSRCWHCYQLILIPVS